MYQDSDAVEFDLFSVSFHMLGEPELSGTLVYILVHRVRLSLATVS